MTINLGWVEDTQHNTAQCEKNKGSGTYVQTDTVQSCMPQLSLHNASARLRTFYDGRRKEPSCRVCSVSPKGGKGVQHPPFYRVHAAHPTESAVAVANIWPGSRESPKKQIMQHDDSMNWHF